MKVPPVVVLFFVHSLAVLCVTTAATAAPAGLSLAVGASRLLGLLPLSECLAEDPAPGEVAAVVHAPLGLSYDSGRTALEWVEGRRPLLIDLTPRDEGALDRLLGEMGETLRAAESGDHGGVVIRRPDTGARSLVTILTERFVDPRQAEDDHVEIACHMACWITADGRVEELGGWVEAREWRQAADPREGVQWNATTATQTTWTARTINVKGEALVFAHLVTHRTTPEHAYQSRRMLAWRVRGSQKPVLLMNDLYQKDESFGQGNPLMGAGGYTISPWEGRRLTVDLRGMSFAGAMPERIWVYDGDRLTLQKEK